MRRQVQEMERDLARENEAVELAALANHPSLAGPADDSDIVVKATGDSTPGANGDASGGDFNADDDADARSIYVGNVSLSNFVRDHCTLTVHARSTTQPHLRRFKLILHRVER